MQIRIIPMLALIMMASSVTGQETDDAADPPDAADPVAEAESDQVAGADPDAPKTMSGMSILGNEEAPKSLVIIPWKSSRLGADLSLTNTLDDRARPIDKEVFLRELSFYEIRSGEYRN